jgi:hypothetical protein
MSVSVEEYEVIRVREALLTLFALSRVNDCGMMVWHAVYAMAGEITLWNAINMASLHILTFVGFKLIHGGPLTNMYNANTCRIGLIFQAMIFLTRVFACTLSCMAIEEDILMHRTYLLKMTMIMTLFTSCSYVPAHWWTVFLYPVFTICWLWWHFQCAYMRIGPVVVLVLLIALADNWRTRQENLSWTNFQMMYEVKHAHASLEQALQEVKDAHASIGQLLSAQQRMLASLFDASCICDNSGYITQCTQHLEQLLMKSGAHDSAELAGRHLSSLAASEADNERLRMFLHQAAAGSALHNALTIQASLVSGVTESGHNVVLEAKLFCICIPSLQAPVSSELLYSKHGGFFIGLQTQQQRDIHESDNTHVVPMDEAFQSSNFIKDSKVAASPQPEQLLNADDRVPIFIATGTLPGPTHTDLKSCSSSSAFSEFIRLENTFLTVARRKRKPSGQAKSEPPNIGDRTFDVAGCHVESQSDGHISECMEQPTSTDDGDDELTSSASNMESHGTDVIVTPNMGIMLALRARGIPSVGSLSHSEGHCVICDFTKPHSKSKCKYGFSCKRCHLSHMGLSRSDMRKRNKSNIQGGCLEVDRVLLFRR